MVRDVWDDKVLAIAYVASTGIEGNVSLAYMYLDILTALDRLDWSESTALSL